MLSDESNAKRLEAARLRENSWLDRQAEKQGELEQRDLDQQRVTINEPNTVINEPSTIHEEQGGAKMEERTDPNDPIDTEEFYKEVDEAFSEDLKAAEVRPCSRRPHCLTVSPLCCLS